MPHRMRPLASLQCYLLLITVGIFAPMMSLANAVPLGLPTIIEANDTHDSGDLVTLGERLFNDKRFSANRTISCSSCRVLSASVREFTPLPLISSFRWRLYAGR
jgi:cytochrome c peroxidase